MKKILILLLVFTGFMACENEAIEELAIETNTAEEITLRKIHKVDVCHKGKVINISINAVEAHQAHGDAVDMDGDGYFNIENDCSEIDCDDSNVEVNPGSEEICDDEIDNNCNGEVDEGCLEIGDLHEGGIIFYLDNTGLHGLVAAPHDLDPSSWPDAMQQCEDLIIDNYDDWYLPDQSTLIMLYENLYLQEYGDFLDLFYWSGTEYSDIHSWGILFTDGHHWAVRKDRIRHVRAVRAF